MCDVDHIVVIVNCVDGICVIVCVCGCPGISIGKIGAQYIGDGLKSLTSLTTLDLSGK